MVLIYAVLLVWPVAAVWAVSYPAPRGYVNDFADVISSSDERAIEEVARSLKENGGIELAVVTVDTLEGESIEMYANELANRWGIGEKGEDTGLLFLLALAERKVRIEVGYGLEGDLPDGLGGRILDDYVIPPFKQGDFSQGLLDGSRSIAATLAKQRDFSLQSVSAEEYAVEESSDGGLLSLIPIILFFLFFMGRMRLWPLLFLAGGRSSYYGGGFGSAGRSGGFGGGGFGGFGGGSFGGGGASRGF